MNTLDNRIVIELQRISNRLHWLASIFEIILIKEFSHDQDVMKAVNILRSRLDDADSEL